jgi:DNA invertase Pin-like site-specific DNA recombinase
MATPGRPIDDRDRERIRKLREQGRSVSETARICEVSRPTVRKILSECR